ncbi:hypothetical protein [Actinoallomurus sp. NPDC052274]|uniref:hypothetical protein n=1 Tax=Actinoallomurus sp. NPDC052274 TaxID=3155420 RepID=UPI003430F713
MGEPLPGDGSRLEELVEMVKATYMLVVTYLELLPIPIKLPELTEDWTPAEGLLAAERAREVLLQDQPVCDLIKYNYHLMILDWQTAYDMCAFAQLAGPAPWRLDAIDIALSRAEASSDMLVRHVRDAHPDMARQFEDGPGTDPSDG